MQKILPFFCGLIRGRWHTFTWLEKRASLTPWNITLPVTVFESPDVQQSCKRPHKKFPSQKRLSCHFVQTSTRNAAAPSCPHTPFSHVNDAHVEFECMRTSQLMSCQHRESLVCFVVREVLLLETSQHHIASVFAKSSQITWWCPHDEKGNLRLRLQNQFIRLWDPSTRSNKQIVATFGDEASRDNIFNC